MLKITPRQKELLNVIYNYIKSTGYPPTFEEMRETLNVMSNQSIVDLLKKLRDNNFIKRESSAARGMTIMPLGYEILKKPPLVSFLGFSSAGSPIEMVEIPGEWELLSNDVAQLKGDVFLIKIFGDSMINAGINDGDVVLVRSQKEFSTGEIVLARVGDESTVKRFISEDKPPYVYLKPENPKYENILFSDETKMIGKVISVLKKSYWKQVK